jgi:hypothetical protein
MCSNWRLFGALDEDCARHRFTTKAPLGADVLGDTCRKWACVRWWGLRTSKSAGSEKLVRAISIQWRQARTLSRPLPSTEVAGTFAAVTTRLSDVLANCVESSASARGNKTFGSEPLFEYWLCALFGTS